MLKKALLIAAINAGVFAGFVGQTWGSEIEQIKRQVMQSVCRGKYTYSKETKNFVCQICPPFTSAGMSGSHEEFTIERVIAGKFLPNSEKTVYYIEYKGCEPRAYDFGGHMVMVDGRLYTNDASLAPPLGDCRVVRKQDRDVLVCKSGFTAQGRTVITKQECTLDPQKMYFRCKKIK